MPYQFRRKPSSTIAICISRAKQSPRSAHRFLMIVLTTLISFFALIVAGFSFFVASERFRLDLYNKRYDIYVRTVKFYWVLMLPEEAAAKLGNFEQLRSDFILASRESCFVFPPESGVPQLLDPLNNASFTITSSRETAKGLPPDQIIENQKQFSEAIRRTGLSLISPSCCRACARS